MTKKEDSLASHSDAPLARRAARGNVLRLWRAARRAVSQSPHSLFWRELAANPGQIGAICASSGRLASRMAGWIDLPTAGLVVELGGGTGVITSAILKRGVPAAHLIVVERSAVLAAHLIKRYPASLVIEGDAARLDVLLRELGACGKLPLDAQGKALPLRTIVSGLPLLSLPPEVRSGILQAGSAALAPGGRLIQFTYNLRGRSPWAGAGLKPHHSERVLANLPPARIDVLLKH